MTGPSRVAVLDVGTNSVKCLVAEPLPGEEADLRVLSDRVRVTRLGEGLDRTGRLTPEGIGRTLRVLTEMLSEARAAGAERLAMVGTEALRKAANASDFREALGRVGEEEPLLRGAELRILSGEEEALLSFRAAASRRDLSGGALVFDVGGGSSELILGDGEGLRKRISLPVGALRLHERFLSADPPGPEAAGLARRDALAALEGGAALFRVARGLPLVGIGGTVTTMASVELGLEPYDPLRVQGFRLTRAAAGAQIRRYAAASLEERRKIRGLPRDRAAIVLAGACLVDALMERAGADSLAVSDRGLRYGVALAVLSEEGRAAR